MRLLPWRIVLGLGATSGLATAVFLMTKPLAPVLPVESASPMNSGSVVEPTGTNLDALIHLAVATAPFRTGRRPARMAFDPTLAQGVPEAQAPPPPKPTLVLTGLAWGAEPQAIVEGLPGAGEARVVRVGDTIGGLRVRALHPDRVIISGLDTTWVLKVSAPWE